MKWKLLNKERPKHKDLVLCQCWNKTITLPAIYYDSDSFRGFWFYTTFYTERTVYSKVRLKPKYEIINVKKWKLIDNI